MRLRHLTSTALLTALGAATVSVALPAGIAQAAVACDRYADVNGSDAAAGTQAAPVQTLRVLIDRLSAGQTGCLAAGETFAELDILSKGGSPGAPITITSAPGGAPATYQGQIEIRPTANDLTFTGLTLRGLPKDYKDTAFIVHASRITFSHDDISFPDGLCLNVGTRTAYVAGDAGIESDDVVIDQNRIHDCGTTATPLDASDSGVHGVYIINALRTKVTNNYVYDNADRGIQLWPSAMQTDIENNVLDGNGSALNIGSEAASNYFSTGTVAKNNVISNSVLRTLVDNNWPKGDIAQVVGYFPEGSPDYGNTVTGNCMWEPSRPDKQFDGPGFSQSGNTVTDPMFANRAAKDFTLLAGSPCAGKGPQAATQPQQQPQPATALTVSVSSPVVTAGTAVTVSGALTDPNTGGPVAGQYVDVYARPAGSTADYTWLTSVVTDPAGHLAASPSPTANTEYTLRFFANAGLPSAASGVATVNVAPKVVDTTSKARMLLGQTSTLSGTVSPNLSGAAVTLQQLVGATWTAVAGSTVSAASTVSFAVKPTTSGVTSYRLVVADSTHAQGVSGSVAVTTYAAAVTSVHYDAAGTDSTNLRDEYVVVKNTGSVAVNLSGWTLKVTSSGIVVRLPAYSLGAGAAVVIRTGTGTTTTGNIYLNRTAELWRNTHDTANLVDPLGVLASRASY
jgi:parallel beta-helix repeat protein